MPHDLQPEQRRRLVIQAVVFLALTAAAACQYAVASTIDSIPDSPDSTSSLSGEDWLLELLKGHPEHIRTELGMRAEVFRELVSVLRSYEHQDTRSISLEEQLAIFLYMCVTGLSTRRVGRRFQHSSSTISRYFRKIVAILSSPPFYTTFVTPPDRTPLSSKFKSNPKFWPYFKDAIGVLDGSHIPVVLPVHNRGAFKSRKNFLSQNCLFVCDFDLRFTYVLSGWEGSVSDARICDHARTSSPNIPNGKYLLGDLGYPSQPHLLVPYRRARYHLAERGRENAQYDFTSPSSCFELFDDRPANKYELFNLYHASARNVVERAVGILKHRFRILCLPLPYPIKIQSRMPIALCAIHNFIRIHDPDERPLPNDDPVGGSGGSNVPEPVVDESMEEDSPSRDSIANRMWEDYVARRGRDHSLDMSDV